MRYPLLSKVCMAHCECKRVVLSTIAAALGLLLSAYIAHAHEGLIQDMGSAQLLPPSSKPPHFGIRKSETPRTSMRLPLMHRHQLTPPHMPHFATAEDRIIDLIQMDQMRVMGFVASFHKHLPAYTNATSSSLPSPDKDLAPTLSAKNSSAHRTPRTAKKDFEGKVMSGASMQGNIGQYFVEFSMGTPGQRILFITDTGSDLIWVQCSSQANTSTSASSTFFPKASSTFVPITCSSRECSLVPPPLDATCSAKSPTSCTYAYAYIDFSQTAGTFAFDTIAMRSSSPTTKIQNIAFGCGTNNTGPSITKLGGVIGLGKGPLSFSSQVGHMYGNKFSYCFASFFHRKATSALVFGDDPASTNLTSPLQFTPLISNPIADTFYYLHIGKMKIDEEHLAINSSIFDIDERGNGGVIIDSGTTLTFFLTPVYDMILQAFEKKVHYPLAPSTAGLPLCYNVSKVAKPQFPRISIIFKGGAIFRPPSRNYILSPTHGIKCLGIMGSPGLSVLGNLIQQNYYVEYDRLNNQLAFAKANCSTRF